MSLHPSPEVSLPVDVARQRFAFLAKTGAGKTYDAAVLAEEMLKAGVPIVVIDPMGVWWGLRVGADGRGPGYPVVVFGGEHADLPLDEDKASELADALVATNVSAVIDVSDLSHAALQKFIPSFFDELRRVNREDRHVFIEEAEVVAPQSPQRNETVSLGAVSNFAKRGGNHNLGLSLISQRAASVNKNVLTQSDFMVVLRTSAPQDKEAVAAWAVRRSTDRKALNGWLDSLDGLKDGEAYVWETGGGTMGGVRTTFRQRETFHATRENLKQFDASKVEAMPVDEFVARFRAYFELAEKPDVAPSQEPKQVVAKVGRAGSGESGAPEPSRAVVTPPPPRPEPQVDWRAEAAYGKAPPTDDPPPPPRPVLLTPLAPHQETRTLAPFTLVITKLESPSMGAKVAYILDKHGRVMSAKEIAKEAVEYGWELDPKKIKEYARETEGAVVPHRNAAGIMWRIAKEVKVMMMEVPA